MGKLTAGYIDIESLSSSLNFTRGNNSIIFHRGNDTSSFVRLVINVQTRYINIDNSLINVNTIQEIGFPDETTVFNIGEFIENLQPQWSHPSSLFKNFPESSNNQEIIQPIKVEIICSKINYNGSEVISPINLDTLYFIKGNQSNSGFSMGFSMGFGGFYRKLMNIRPEWTSVVNGGFAIIHVLNKSRKYWAWKNSVSIIEEGFTESSLDNKVISFIQKINTNEAKIEFIYGNDSVNFLVRPEVKELVSVFFRNQHALPEVLNFRGGIVVENDFNYNAKTSYSNFSHRHESLNFDETVTITLSTGGLLPADVPKVIELLKNEIATLYYKGKEFFVNPIKQKITHFNSSSNINQFSVKLNMSKRDYDSII